MDPRKIFNTNNKQGMQWSFIYTCTCNTRMLHFNFKGRMDLKGLLSTSIASATTAAERLLEEMGAIQIESSQSFQRERLARSLSAFLLQINLRVNSYHAYLKHCGDLVWCMLGRMLTLCKRTVTCRPRLRRTQAPESGIHQRNFAGSRTLSSLDSIVH